QGRVSVGDVQQGHVAERLEGHEPLRTIGGFEALRRESGARGDREQLQEVAPRDVHSLVTDARHAEGLTVVERGQVELQLRVLDRVRREHVHAERRYAPLEALAYVPYFGPVGAPRREVPRA